MKKINIFNLIMLIAIIIGDIFYMIYDSIYIKAFTSLLFVIVGLVNLIYIFKHKAENRRFPIFMLIGLFFAFLGDVLLEIHFITGAALFATGHIFFFVSYCFIQRFNWKDLIAGLIIFLPSVLLITLAPIFTFDILMEIVCVVYALIISLMVGKAVSNLIREKSILNIIILIGSILFFFSDMMLLFNVFGHLPVVGYLCLATYYPAEFLLGYSILKSHKGEKTNDKK